MKSSLPLSRRRFLHLFGATIALAACAPKQPTAAPTQAPKVEPTQAPQAAATQPPAPTQAPQPTAVPPTAVPQPTGPQGKIVIARGGNLRWSHPFGGGLYEGETSAHMYEGLVRTRPGTKDYIGVLAKEWAQDPDDPRTWTFKLHQGVKFANGEEFTAKDLKASYEWVHADPTLIMYNVVFPKVEIDNIVDVDDYTFKITTNDPYPAIALVPLISAASRKAIEADPTGWSEKPGAGTGPWKLVRWDRDGIEMTANENYRDMSQVLIKDYQYRFIGEEATKLAALKTGEVHVIDQVPFEQVQGLQDDPNFVVQYSKTTDIMHLNMNCGEPPFDNPLARKAAMYAVDRQAIIDAVLGGAAELISQPAPDTWPEHNPDLKPFPYDPEKSKALLQEAGFELPVKVKLIQPNAWFPKVLEVPQAIAAQMKPAGFDVEVVVLEGGAFTAGRKGSDYNFAFMQFGAGVDLDTSAYSGRITQDNWGTQWDKTPEYAKTEELVLAARREFDPEKRAQIYRDLEALLYETGPRVILYRNWYIWGLSKAVQDFTTWESTYEIRGTSLDE